jgi:hypothetical protein
MGALKFVEINTTNKYIAKELLIEYGSYLYDDFKHTAGRESFFNELEKFPGDKYLSPKGGFFCYLQRRNPYWLCRFKKI